MNTWTGNHFSDVASYPYNRTIAGSAINHDTTARPAVPPLSVATTLIPCASGAGPQAMAVADFDGDLNDDLAVVNAGAGNVTIHYGNGTGGFSGTTETITMPSGTSSPVAITTGKFHSGARIDLAIACDSGHLVTVFNTNTSQPYFTTPVEANITGASMDVHDHPAAIAAGNVNGDAYDDILLALQGETFRAGRGLLLTNSSTTPGGEFSGVNLTVTCTAAQGCTLSDLDGDTDLDAVVTEAGTPLTDVVNWVRVFMNDSGTFAEVTPALPGGLNPRAVTCADLDGDDLPEIIVANFGDPILSLTKGSVSVYPNQSTTTGIAFGTGVETEADLGTQALVVIDAFKDSTADDPRLDVAAVNLLGNSVSLFMHWDRIENRFRWAQSYSGLAFPFGGSVRPTLTTTEMLRSWYPAHRYTLSWGLKARLRRSSRITAAAPLARTDSCR